MGTLFKKQVPRPVPAGAILTRRPDGTELAKWTPRGARRPVVAEVAELADGRKVVRRESTTYFVRYRDADGVVHEVTTGCREEAAARQFLADLEKRAERVRSGVITHREVQAAEQSAGPIGEQIDAYLASLAGSPTHRKDVERYLRRLATDCRWTRLSELRRDDLERWQVEQSRPVGGGRPVRSARTRNAHQIAAVAFVNWCIRSGRMTSNPFARMPKANEDADPRRKRRALSPVELGRLVAAALAAPGRPALKPTDGDAPKGDRPAERFSGPDRAALYAFLAGTGLRLGEARRFKVADLDLSSGVPCVRLPASITKNGRADAVPLRADLVAMLRERVADLPADAVVFDAPADLIRRFNADCKRAGIVKRDARGRTVDIHSLRTTFGTYLATAGVAPRVAQSLMRHSDIRLTMQVYTDPALFDLAGAVESIPSVATSVAETPRIALHSGSSQSNEGRRSGVA